MTPGADRSTGMTAYKTEDDDEADLRKIKLNEKSAKSKRSVVCRVLMKNKLSPTDLENKCPATLK